MKRRALLATGVFLVVFTLGHLLGMGTMTWVQNSKQQNIQFDKIQELFASTADDLGEGKLHTMPVDARRRPNTSGLLKKILAKHDAIANESDALLNNADAMAPPFMGDENNITKLLMEGQKLYRGSYIEDPAFWKQV